jgi:hypothetical protein
LLVVPGCAPTKLGAEAGDAYSVTLQVLLNLQFVVTTNSFPQVVQQFALAPIGWLFRFSTTASDQ